MARNYTQIMCAIWDDPEFLALSEAAQRAYFMLVSQKDISAAGVLRIWTPRWASMSRTSTDESLKAALSELKAARFIVPDWVTGELLVRSFVRWDGGYKNSKRLPVILREARAVSSLEIKSQLRVEFERLSLDTSGLPSPPPPDRPSGSPSDRASDVSAHSNGIHVDGLSASNLTAIVMDSDTPSSSVTAITEEIDRPTLFPQVDSPSDVVSDSTSPLNGVVVTYRTTREPTTPQPHNPPPTAAETSSLAVVVDADEINAGDVVAAWAESFTETGNRPTARQRGQVAKEASDLLKAGNDPQRVVSAARALGAKGRSTLVTELAIRSTSHQKNYEPAAFGWQAMKQPTGTDGHRPLRAISGGASP